MPVAPQVDLPGVASDQDRDVLQKVAAALRSAYPDMFKVRTARATGPTAYLRLHLGLHRM